MRLATITGGRGARVGGHGAAAWLLAKIDDCCARRRQHRYKKWGAGEERDPRKSVAPLTRDASKSDIKMLRRRLANIYEARASWRFSV